jgi:hypothetical protein
MAKDNRSSVQGGEAEKAQLTAVCVGLAYNMAGYHRSITPNSLELPVFLGQQPHRFP